MVNREKILEAAARVYAKHGFRGATTRLIAIEAGVNEVTLFRTFGSKGALLEAVLRQQKDDGSGVPSLPETPGDPHAELTLFTEGHLRKLRELRPLLVQTMSELEERPEAADFACRGRTDVHDMLVRYATALQRQRLSDGSADVPTAVTMLTSTVMGDVMGRPMVPAAYPPVEEAASRYVHCFLRAIGVEQSSAKPRRSPRRLRAMALLIALLLPLVAVIAGAQQTTAASTASDRTLSLDDAIRLAARESEALQIARAGVTRAEGQQKQARSLYLPQVNSSLAYARTLRSQFSALAGGSSPDTTTGPQLQSVCAPNIPANATQAERNAALAQAQSCAATQGIDFSRVGFGARNQYTFGLTVAQSVFSGGRNEGQNTAASAGRRSAEIEVTSQRAQLALDVTQAYFDAVLADRLVDIADTTLAQTEELLRQTQLARRVGNQSEFELLRATVTRDNQRPLVIQRRGDRDVAYLRLKQLLNLPLEQPLTLTTPIDEPATISRVVAQNAATTPTALAIDTLAPLQLTDTTTSNRAPVRESEEALRAQEGLLRVARADRLPTFSLSTNYQRLFFPQTFLPTLSQYSENWTVGGSIALSLFSGGRVSGQIEVAQANLDEARARLQQSRELAALDTRVALNQLQAAEAAFAASRGTAQQAQRAYSIDQLRYREGISTQTDLTQSRLLLEQALANRAQSARDLAVARARVALIRDLPVNSAALGAAAQRATQQQQSQQLQQQQTQSQRTPIAAASAGTGQFGGTTP